MIRNVLKFEISINMEERNNVSSEEMVKHVEKALSEEIMKTYLKKTIQELLDRNWNDCFESTNKLQHPATIQVNVEKKK